MELINMLPEYISTSLLIGALIGIYKLALFFKRVRESRKESQEEFKNQVLKEERERADLNRKVKDLEEEMIRVKEDLKEHKNSNALGFDKLEKKIDSLSELIIKFFSKKT